MLILLGQNDSLVTNYSLITKTLRKDQDLLSHLNAWGGSTGAGAPVCPSPASL